MHLWRGENMDKEIDLAVAASIAWKKAVAALAEAEALLEQTKRAMVEALDELCAEAGEDGYDAAFNTVYERTQREFAE
jgi:hypothetical protein